MYANSSLRTGIARGLSFILLAASLVSCNLVNSFGSSSAPTSTPVPSLGSVTVTASNVSRLMKAWNYTFYAFNLLTNQPTPPINKAPVFADVPGLHIQSTEGLQCPLSGGRRQSDDLVFTTGRLTYRKNEIQQIRNYLDNGDRLDPSTPWYTLTPPPTLHWISGSTVCSFYLEISNTGKYPVQISSLGAYLSSAPRPNSSQSLHTLDFCSVSDVGCQPIFPSSFFVCTANITLTPHAGSMVTATPTLEGGACPGLMLNPNDPNHPNDLFGVEMNLSSSAPDIYSVVPVLKVTDANGSPHTYMLSSMAGFATFVAQQQITCYGLLHKHDITFVPVSTFPANTLTRCLV